jgi:hypothetical protein
MKARIVKLNEPLQVLRDGKILGRGVVNPWMKKEQVQK